VKYLDEEIHWIVFFQNGYFKEEDMHKGMKGIYIDSALLYIIHMKIPDKGD